MAFGYSHQEMIDTVASEVANADISSNITTWLNLIITELASQYVFGTLNTYDSSFTVVGNPDIVLADDFYWLKTIGIPTQQRKLYPEDEQRIAEGYPQYRTLRGTVSHYYLNGNILGLWQVPSSVFIISYSYQRRPIKLVGPNDYSDLPYEWHPLIIQKAITKAYSQEGNDTGFANSLQMEARLSRGIKISTYRRPDDLFVLNGPSARSRVPRPKLPGNFPTG